MHASRNEIHYTSFATSSYATNVNTGTSSAIFSASESFSLLLYIFIFALHHPFLDSLHFLSWSLIERMHNAHQYYIYSFASLFLIYLVNHYLSVILTKCFNSIASSSTLSVHHTTSGSFSQQLHFQRQNHNSVVG